MAWFSLWDTQLKSAVPCCVVVNVVAVIIPWPHAGWCCCTCGTIGGFGPP